MFYSKTARLMGNRFVISIDDRSETDALKKIDEAIAEISRIEALLTTFSDSSITYQVNENAGVRSVVVPDEFFYLVQRAQKISILTEGAFDLSYGSIDKRLWNFDETMTLLPTEEAKRNLHLVNYKNIVLNEDEKSIFLRKKGMRIGFGGIGKGYAADKAAELLKTLSVKNGVVNAAGDLKTWGKYNDEPWTINIANPDAPQHPFSELKVSDMAVATSGTYEKFVIIDGKRYSHTLDPKTGLPVSGTKSITVICPIAELADAMTTPLAILGVKKGLSLINRMDKVACVIIDDNNRVFTSNNLL